MLHSSWRAHGCLSRCDRLFTAQKYWNWALNINGVQVFSPLKDHLHKWRPYFLQEMLKWLWNENGSSDSVCFSAPLLSHNKHWAHQTESLSGKPVLLILQHIAPLCLADYYHMPKQAQASTEAFGVPISFGVLSSWKMKDPTGLFLASGLKAL